MADICARLACNFCQYLTTVTSGANSLVGWLSAILQLAGWESDGELGKSVSIALHNLTLSGPGGESREGGCVPSPCQKTVFSHCKV